MRHVRGVEDRLLRRGSHGCADAQHERLRGHACIRELDREDADAVPIIAMSANAFAEDVSASLASGMNAHLSKPIDMRRVLATLIKYVRKRYEG